MEREPSRRVEDNGRRRPVLYVNTNIAPSSYSDAEILVGVESHLRQAHQLFAHCISAINDNKFEDAEMFSNSACAQIIVARNRSASLTEKGRKKIKRWLKDAQLTAKLLKKQCEYRVAVEKLDEEADDYVRQLRNKAFKANPIVAHVRSRSLCDFCS